LYLWKFVRFSNTLSIKPGFVTILFCTRNSYSRVHWRLNPFRVPKVSRAPPSRTLNSHLRRFPETLPLCREALRLNAWLQEAAPFNFPCVGQFPLPLVACREKIHSIEPKAPRKVGLLFTPPLFPPVASPPRFSSFLRLLIPLSPFVFLAPPLIFDHRGLLDFFLFRSVSTL